MQPRARCAPGSRSWSAAGPRVPGRPAAPPPGSTPAAAWRCPSRCTRRGSRSGPVSTSLAGADVPTLVVQGERDPFGRPEEFPDPLPGRTDLAVVPGADHGLAVPKRGPVSEDEAMAIVVESTLEWIVREILGAG
ncbi:alpha/beta hydrolase [Nocardioides convexus]|uniref:alpha/beta hydrolase n=1 Tax=Nocardioides convexus TaxID=2712224 RepID=UPI003101AED1